MGVKKLFAGVAAVAVTLSLAACGSGTSASGKTELNVYVYDLETQVSAMFKEFQKENPDIVLKASYMPTSGDYAQSLQTRIAGNKTPDVFTIISDNLVDIKNNKVALDLSGDAALEGIPDTYLSTFAKDGKIYGMPTQAWMGFIVYNKDLVKAAGYDEFPTTWDDFITMGKKMKSNGVTYPFLEGQGAFSYSFEALLGSKYKAEGETEVDQKIADGKTTFAKEYLPVLNVWKKAIDEGILTPDSLSLTGDALNQAFLSNDLGMYTTGIWDAPTLQKSGMNYGVAPFPAYPGGEPFVAGAVDHGFAISAKSSPEKQEAAKKLLRFINSETGLKLYCEGNGYASISSKYTAPAQKGFEAAYEATEKGNIFWTIFQKDPAPITADQIAKTQEMIQGKTTPEELVKSLDQKMQSAR
ncbi:family 1 extracellular solute-binding protein [Bifidobacterium ramosum]|uniref:Extracellular solute-binding protein n=1 Tax=Bifidobacterium ramosum TaxID=1798158 RepID=A0A6L4WX83_9BIFI|nr:extracellular solute-binding protein [Bifidobacterium ramosum]KAB8286590.1 family 1 extracellular solute-binding protein [Bifidobacterium ramosum]NEG72861.1 extracellular solute-binding protein [Bifidobacterium ramosum]